MSFSRQPRTPARNAAAGLPLEVMHGLTAACGVASHAVIPLTLCLTGHIEDGSCESGWPAFARSRQSVAIYTGRAGLPTICAHLIAHGLPAN